MVYQQVNFFSNVVKSIRPTYSIKEEVVALKSCCILSWLSSRALLLMCSETFFEFKFKNSVGMKPYTILIEISLSDQ